jgi:hypothetical protein
LLLDDLRQFIHSVLYCCHLCLIPLSTAPVPLHP